jgi:hypothetical protein
MTPPTSNPSSAMSQEPLPCAFCGAVNPTVFQNAVVCKACSASGPDLGHTRDKPGAIAAWNHRPALLPLQRKLVEALGGLVKAIEEIEPHVNSMLVFASVTGSDTPGQITWLK